MARKLALGEFKSKLVLGPVGTCTLGLSENTEVELLLG